MNKYKLTGLEGRMEMVMDEQPYVFLTQEVGGHQIRHIKKHN
jgi:hypothetical protein